MVLQKGGGTKFTKKMGKFVLNNFQTMTRSKMSKILKIKRFAIDRFCKLNKLKTLPSKLEKQTPEIIKQIKSGKTQTEVAKNFNTSISTISALLKRNKIQKPKTNKHKDLDFFIKNNQHLNCAQIARIKNISQETVRNRFIKLNIKRKTPAETHTKWTEDTIKKEALKFKTKQLFFKNSNGAYQKAWKLNILDKVCSHMIPAGDLYNRWVYIYQFSDESVYVGVTLNKHRRHKQHKTKGIIKNRTLIKYKTSKLLPAAEAILLEQKMVDLFKSNNYKVLNRVKCTSLGFVKEIWTKEKCKNAAKLCKTRNEFNRKFSTASKKSRENGWYEEFVKHMPKNNTLRKVRHINSGKVFQSIALAANQFKTYNSRIANALMNKKPTLGSYWEYVK